MQPPQKEKGGLDSRDMEKAELFPDFFDSVFTGKNSNHTAYVPEGKGQGGENDKPPIVGEDQFRDLI